MTSDICYFICYFIGGFFIGYAVCLWKIVRDKEKIISDALAEYRRRANKVDGSRWSLHD